jgi:dethiobiotin synthetase
MSAPLLLVTGTGTEIGKTVVAVGLTEAWSRRDEGRAIAGLKPVESGVPHGDLGPDAVALGQVSTFHVTRFTPPYLLMDPVSPHLAARREGRVVEPGVIHRWLAPIRQEADGVVLELPGGLFTPLAEGLTNADLIGKLAPTKLLLVAPDRIGVLHDILATSRAARALGLTIDGIVLSTPAVPDASTATNAEELTRVAPTLPILAVLPRASRAANARHFDAILHQLGL